MRRLRPFSFRIAVTIAADFAAFVVFGLVMFSTLGAPALERSGAEALVVAGVGVAAFLLLALRVARRSLWRADLDRELRKLLEEEAGRRG